MKSSLKMFFPNYVSFFFNGAIVLMTGSVLPFIMEETGINYSVAGLLLSLFAAGNFLASFINPFLTKIVGRKASVVITSCFQPVALMLLTFKMPASVLAAVFFILGVSRGCYSIINNAYINEKSGGGASALNILHMVFAIGAFSAPLFLSLCENTALGWQKAVWVLASGSLLSLVLLFTLDLGQNAETSGVQSETAVQRKPFWKESVFYISGLLLFFYLGLENCVNGWFVSYLCDTGIMSQTFANSLVSFTWAAVLAGRLSTAALASKIKPKYLILADCAATGIFFILLISSKNLALITVSIIGLGFFFAGIYPTTVANAGAAIRGSDFGTSMLLAIAAAGGIITPQIVGAVADKTALSGAITILVVNVAAMIALGILNAVKTDSGAKSGGR